MSLSNIKQDLVTILTSIDGVSCSFDYSTIEESAKSIVIDSMEFTYQHDLDMGWHKELRATAVLITRNAGQIPLSLCLRLTSRACVLLTI